MPSSPKRSAVRAQARSTGRAARPRRQAKATKNNAESRRKHSDAGRRPSGQGRGSGGRALATLFPKVAKNPRLFGLAGVCGVVEGDGTKPTVTVGRLEALFAKPARRPRERFVSAASDEQIAKLCNAMANPRRVAMLKAIFTGAGSYARLAETLGLRAGPLYHHVRELRLAGLLELAQRDTYRLTEYGKYALLLACLTQSLLSSVRASKPK